MSAPAPARGPFRLWPMVGDPSLLAALDPAEPGAPPEPPAGDCAWWVGLDGALHLEPQADCSGGADLLHATRGVPVLGAGCARFEEGQLVRCDNRAPDYACDPTALRALFTGLEEGGCAVSEAAVTEEVHWRRCLGCGALVEGRGAPPAHCPTCGAEQDPVWNLGLDGLRRGRDMWGLDTMGLRAFPEASGTLRWVWTPTFDGPLGLFYPPLSAHLAVLVADGSVWWSERDRHARALLRDAGRRAALTFLRDPLQPHTPRPAPGYRQALNQLRAPEFRVPAISVWRIPLPPAWRAWLSRTSAALQAAPPAPSCLLTADGWAAAWVGADGTAYESSNPVGAHPVRVFSEQLLPWLAACGVGEVEGAARTTLRYL